MFGRKHSRRSTNIVFVIFRLILSLTMFIVLLGGVYSAYKHFSGLDPLKLDPQSVAKNFLEARTPQQFLEVLSSLKVSDKVLGQTNKGTSRIVSDRPASSKLLFRFLLLADSHNDNASLKRAIAQARRVYSDLSFIIGLGDYTDVGTLEELKKAKDEFDLSGLRYFLLAGDHDLWDSRNRNLPPVANFKEVFGPPYQSFTFNNLRFLLLDNSDNYEGLGVEQQKWASNELDKAKEEKVSGIFVFIHEPLYHPSSDHFMGRVEKQLKQEAKGLIYQFKAAGIKKVFSGDIHYFSEYEDPETKLSMVTVGAITTERNPQLPRFTVVSVFEDGTTKVEDIQIK